MGGAFRHGVASGDPTPDRVVIWTRVNGVEGPAEVRWWVVPVSGGQAGSAVAEGVATADPERDHTVHVDVGGLEPATSYRYGFSTGDEASPEGRTRTLPGGGAERVRFAMCSCAKYSAGYFNAYARIADRAGRGEVDFLLHLGDYIYEVGNHPPAGPAPHAHIGRRYDPPNECVTLADYRRRYAHYRLDPDVRRLHHALPVIGAVDDHEFADGVWREGSVEHRNDRDGPWAERRAAAFRARWEWQPYRMPDGQEPERAYQLVVIGDLADLFVMDTRTRRDEPAGGEALADPSRTQLGAEQRDWLLEGVAGSPARWRILANSSVMTHVWDPRLPRDALEGLKVLKMLNRTMDGPDPDQWDGYGPERDAILAAMEARGPGTTVVLSGDIHVAMANELRRDPLDPTGRPVAAEFVTTSLTSENVDDKQGWAPRTHSIAVEEAMTGAVPHLRWLDLDSHGYMVVEVTPERVVGEWWFVDSVLERTDGEWQGAAFAAEHGDPVPKPVWSS